MVSRKILVRKRDIIPYLENRTAKEVGKIFGLSDVTIKAYIMDLRKAGYNIPNRKSGRRRIPLD